MAKRRNDQSKYLDPRAIPDRDDPPELFDVAMAVPAAIAKLGDSAIKKHEAKIDWSLYKIVMRNGNPFVVRETCDRCGKNWVPPSWRKTRSIETETCGTLYVESGLCKDCINASLYYDKYFIDTGVPDTFSDLQKQFYTYAEEYERAWRVVLAAAPAYLMTEDEWQRRCNFFNGCAMCGGRIEVRTMYFPRYLNGSYSPWNVIPLCGECQHKHYAGRTTKGKAVKRYKVFSTLEHFQKSKEIRVYLLNEMDKYDIYREPLAQFRTRFFETKTFEEKYL